MSLPLTAGRMAALSDGVIAVVITIMVLELKIPERDLSDLEGLRKVAPMLMIYALSFVEVGIYWVNHHYMLDDVEQVSHGVLWANLSFLFTLSLIPFGTAWIGERGITPFALSLYSICCALPAISWMALAGAVRLRTHSPLAGGAIKQAVSFVLYAAVIPVSHHSLKISMVMLGATAVLWLIPPKRASETMPHAL